MVEKDDERKILIEKVQKRIRKDLLEVRNMKNDIEKRIQNITTVKNQIIGIYNSYCNIEQNLQNKLLYIINERFSTMTLVCILKPLEWIVPVDYNEIVDQIVKEVDDKFDKSEGCEEIENFIIAEWKTKAYEAQKKWNEMINQ